MSSTLYCKMNKESNYTLQTACTSTIHVNNQKEVKIYIKISYCVSNAVLVIDTAKAVIIARNM